MRGEKKGSYGDGKNGTAVSAVEVPIGMKGAGGGPAPLIHEVSPCGFEGLICQVKSCTHCGGKL